MGAGAVDSGPENGVSALRKFSASTVWPGGPRAGSTDVVARSEVKGPRQAPRLQSRKMSAAEPFSGMASRNLDAPVGLRHHRAAAAATKAR
eukprot:11599783-Heterocapsa_arctica.AAC.1